MQTLIHYATPPGWRPRPTLPTLRRETPRPRPQPAPRTGVRPDPEDTRPDPYAQMGMAWQVYFLGTFMAASVAVSSTWMVARHGWASPAVPVLMLAAVMFGVCLGGLRDYARLGAQALRAAQRRAEQDL